MFPAREVEPSIQLMETLSCSLAKTSEFCCCCPVLPTVVLIVVVPKQDPSNSVARDNAATGWLAMSVDARYKSAIVAKGNGQNPPIRCPLPPDVI